MTQLFYRFAYYIPRKGDRELQPHHLRDGQAFVEITAILNSLGLQFGDVILNYPADDFSKVRRVNSAYLKSEDLLVLNTRLPLHDVKGGAKKHLVPSNTNLEKRVFKVFELCFDVLTREHAKLSKHLAAQLPERYANRAHIHFRQNVGASYRFLKGHGEIKWKQPKFSPRTALYFVLTPNLPRGGPKVLATFGMGGAESLVWAYLLRKRYWNELAISLDRPRFIMAEMESRDLPKRPTDLFFANKWELDILLDVFL